jgi:protein TonB
LAALTLPSVALRACLLGTSAAVHVVALVTLGHGPAAPASEGVPAESVAVDELVPSVEDPGPGPTPEAPPRAPLAPRVARRHGYPGAPHHDPRLPHPHDAAPVDAPLAAAHDEPPATALPRPDLAPPDEPPARFSMVASTPRAGGPDPAWDRHAPPTGDSDAPLPESAVSRPARPVAAIEPAYPAAARADGIEADVRLVIVVSAEGAVSDARVEKRAGYGFDEAALVAVRAARFEPARSGGRAVAVRMRLGYSFRLE